MAVFFNTQILVVRAGVVSFLLQAVCKWMEFTNAYVQSANRKKYRLDFFTEDVCLILPIKSAVMVKILLLVISC